MAGTLDPHGWGLTAGDTTGVGAGGLTLGGASAGWCSGTAWRSTTWPERVVTADGRLLTASAQENPDLFWALRGGSANSGVVTDFDFIAQPVTTVHYRSVGYRLDDPADLLLRWFLSAIGSLFRSTPDSKRTDGSIT
ncbi:hypothetical protein ABT299_05815 [Spirillospora sp. NPDC000708]